MASLHRDSASHSLKTSDAGRLASFKERPYHRAVVRSCQQPDALRSVCDSARVHPDGLDPARVLATTFTRKAAAEMLTRAARLVGDKCARVSGGTFHSLANELLRRWARRLGYPTSFGIMDRGDMEEVLGRLRTQAGLGKNDRRFPRRSTLATIVSKAVNKGLSIEDLVLQDFIHLNRYLGEIESLAQEYTVYKQENALLDFYDIDN